MRRLHLALTGLALTVLAVLAATASAEPAPWQIDYERSRVEFVAEQAGAEFKGHWSDWRADVRFDPGNLAASSASVVFRASSVVTHDSERDSTLQETDWFDGKRHPMLRFEASHFRAEADGGYVAASELLIRGRRTPLEFRFRLHEEGGWTLLAGEARIDRILAGVGTGEWLDTNWIGQFVHVNVRLYAQVKEALPE